MIELYPTLFHRVSSSQFHDLNSLIMENLIPLIEKMGLKNECRTKLKNDLTVILYERINQCVEADARNKLLNYKRSIHNLRPLKSEEVTFIHLYLNDEQSLIFNRFLESGEEYALLYSQTYKLYKNSMPLIRKNFRKLIRENIEFQKSLQISSQSLFDQLLPYLNKDFATLKKTQIQAEYSLIKYITRQYAKTSPFSRFTCLSVSGGLDNQGKITACVRLNNYIFSYIKGLLFQVPEIVKHIPIALNPSLKVSGDNYDFLVNFSNVEVFQKVGKSTVIELIINLADNSRSIFEITRLLLLKYPDTPARELERYMEQLIGTGLIAPYLGISGTDPLWAEKFITFLEDLCYKDNAVIHLKETLSMLVSKAEKIGVSDIQERNDLLKTSYLQFKEGVRKFCNENALPFTEGTNNKEAKHEFIKQFNGNDAFSIQYFNGFYFTIENIFYEDAKIASLQTYPKKDLKILAFKLDTIYRIMLKTSSFQLEKHKLLHFYNQNYAENEQVSLMEFYRQYYTQYKKSEKTIKRRKILSEDNGHKFTQLLEKEDFRNGNMETYKSRLFELMGKNYQTKSRQLNFTETDFFEIFDKETAPYKPYSKAAHLQFYKPKENANYYGVVNGIFNGYGRGYGRFLHMFPENITEETRAINKHLLADSFASEIKDASCFNANGQPPLMPYEIVIPGGNADLHPANQLPIQDISIKKANGGLKLIHEPTGTEILPFDLCLQTNSTRSELYQLLTMFSPSEPVNLHTFQNWVYEFIERNFPNQEGTRFPRISFEDELVLFRECWKIPKKYLPKDDAPISDFDYFVQVDRWRKYYEVPRFSFVFINPANQSAENNATYDDYKPQFIDFHSPLLVRLFRKACRKAGKYLRIEEMLPAPEHLEENRVSESLIQWYHE